MSERAPIQYSEQERLAPPDFSKIEFPPPLSQELQPSRQELVPFVPLSKLYLEPYLPHHGQLHGEETMIWTAVIMNQVHEDVLSRKGSQAAERFLAKIDQKSLLYAAAYHDCGRLGDWLIVNNRLKKWLMRMGFDLESITSWEFEGKEHGPRGASHIDNPDSFSQIDPSLTTKQKETIVTIIRDHTPDIQTMTLRKKEKAEFKKGRRHIEDYDPEELMLRLVQEADTLALVRTWYSHPTYGSFNPIVSKMRTQKLQYPDSRRIENSLILPHTAAFIPLAHAHAAMDRHDPELNHLFLGSERAGVALEAAQRLGILKS